MKYAHLCLAVCLISTSFLGISTSSMAMRTDGFEDKRDAAKRRQAASRIQKAFRVYKTKKGLSSLPRPIYRAYVVEKTPYGDVYSEVREREYQALWWLYSDGNSSHIRWPEI